MSAHALRAVQTGEHLTTPHDGLLHLASNLNIHPDLLIGDGNSILGTGMPGSGKTTVLALLLEQFGACGIPFATFDLEGDLKSVVDFLPRGVLATPDNCPTAEDMYKGGLQVIFDLASWGDDSNRAGVLITRTVNGLLALMRTLPEHVRVPFLVGLDEAAYWLPQVRKGKDYLSPACLAGLFAAFHTCAVRGRKHGLIPMLFTQRFADVHKDVLAPGTYILMRQTTDTDLKRYMEYVNASAFGEDEGDITEKQIRARIAAFKKGQAIVKMPNGKQRSVQFNNRQSPHLSHAPKSVAAANLYRDVQFDPARRYGSDHAVPLEEDMLPDSGSSAPSKLSIMPTLAVDPHASRSTASASPSIREQVFSLLTADPTLATPALAAITKHGVTAMRRYRNEYFTQYPERLRKQPPTTKEWVFSLLDADPSLSPSALVTKTGCNARTIQGYCVEYSALHPDRRVERRDSTLKARVFALLDADPSLSSRALAKTLDRPSNTVQIYHTEYFILHPEKRPSPQPSKMEQNIRALLKENPNYTASQMAHRTNYSSRDVKRVLARIQAEGGRP